MCVCVVVVGKDVLCTYVYVSVYVTVVVMVMVVVGKDMLCLYMYVCGTVVAAVVCTDVLSVMYVLFTLGSITH